MEEAAVTQLGMEALMDPTNLFVMAVVVAFIEVLKTTVLKEAFATPLGQRLLPMVPIVLCTALCFGGIVVGATGVLENLVLGAAMGLSAGGMFKVGKTVVLGKGLPGLPEEEASKEE